MESATIHLTRYPNQGDRFRAYRIVLDGTRAGTIRGGNTCSFEVQPGHHDLFLTIDWASSPHLSLDLAAGAEVQMICQGRNPGIGSNLLLALKLITVDAHDYIDLHQAS
jgi:hypothetical protein